MSKRLHGNTKKASRSKHSSKTGKQQIEVLRAKCREGHREKARLRLAAHV